jgi:hypothetical protein
VELKSLSSDIASKGAKDFAELAPRVYISSGSGAANVDISRLVPQLEDSGQLDKAGCRYLPALDANSCPTAGRTWIRFGSSGRVQHCS